MTNGPRKPKKGSYSNKPKPQERPDFFPFPTEEDAVQFAVFAGYGVTGIDTYPRIAHRPDQPERKFALKRIFTPSTINKSENVAMVAWMEIKKGKN
jgi:hypothetical protein